MTGIPCKHKNAASHNDAEYLRKTMKEKEAVEVGDVKPKEEKQAQKDEQIILLFKHENFLFLDPKNNKVSIKRRFPRHKAPTGSKALCLILFPVAGLTGVGQG
jgi:hypothetical protein